MWGKAGEQVSLETVEEPPRPCLVSSRFPMTMGHPTPLVPQPSPCSAVTWQMLVPFWGTLLILTCPQCTTSEVINVGKCSFFPAATQ